MTDDGRMQLQFDIDFELVQRLAEWLADQTETPAKAMCHAAVFVGQVAGFTAVNEESLKEGLELIEAIMRVAAFKSLELAEQHRGELQ